MPEPKPRSSSRRRRVTPETLVEAGIELTLPKVTVKALAEKLGVSIVAIYNNIDCIDTLRTLVAEEILQRWQFPMPGDHDTLQEALLHLSVELRALVHGNPGIARYLLDLDADSPRALNRIDAVDQRYAQLFELNPMQARWAVTTVSEHAIALAELIHTPDRRSEDGQAILARTDLTLIPLTVDGKERDSDTSFEWSMRAVIMGTAVVVGHPRFATY